MKKKIFLHKIILIYNFSDSIQWRYVTVSLSVGGTEYRIKLLMSVGKFFMFSRKRKRKDMKYVFLYGNFVMRSLHNLCCRKCRKVFLPITKTIIPFRVQMKVQKISLLIHETDYVI